MPAPRQPVPRPHPATLPPELPPLADPAREPALDPDFRRVLADYFFDLMIDRASIGLGTPKRSVARQLRRNLGAPRPGK